MNEIASSEFIVGGQRSGKSRRAEMLAATWLAADAGNKATFIATATAWDDEMRSRIERHRADRRERVPKMATIESPKNIASVVQAQDDRTLVVVDCLTLWLTNLSMPESADIYFNHDFDFDKEVAAFIRAIANRRGPTVIVSNEIGLGVIPMGAETRLFVDQLGTLNQLVANVCERATFMASGIPLFLKDKNL